MTQDKVLVGSAIKHYRDTAMGRLNISFCTSIKHAELTADAFRDAGIPAAHVSGSMDDKEIAMRIKAFARRELLVLANCDLMCFGFDLASAANMDVTIECMSDLRPTKSLPLQLQKWGRVLRYKDQPAIILDHAGNSKPDFHGLPDSDREWSLEGKDSKKGGEKTEPTRQCGECFFVHRPAPVCPHCGNTLNVVRLKYPSTVAFFNQVRAGMAANIAITRFTIIPIIRFPPPTRGQTIQVLNPSQRPSR